MHLDVLFNKVILARENTVSSILSGEGICLPAGFRGRCPWIFVLGRGANKIPPEDMNYC